MIQTEKKTKIFCVTGPMAAGKNIACKILEAHGFLSVDADLLVHEAIENVKEKILSTFGEIAKKKNIPLLDENGKINRRNLGSIIFDSPKLIKMQEEIVYPQVNFLIQKFIDENDGKNIILNATVLYKVPSINLVNTIIFVDAPLLVRFFRAKKRDNLSSAQILKRFKSQKNLFSKYKNSNADIKRVWNFGSEKCLEKKLLKIIEKTVAK